MNEQDFMKQIHNQTTDLPIPDSISPENMKRMLDEQIERSASSQTIDTKEAPSESNIANMQTTSIGKKNRKIRHFAAAACVVLCVVGSITAIHLNNKDSIDTIPRDDVIETADESEANETEESNTKNELVTQSSLQSPSSYDAYYDTLSSAYQEYYDALAEVATNETDIYEEEMAVESDGAMFESAKENGMVTESVEDSATATTDSATNSRTSTDGGTSANKDFSSTNTQEKNVDEGDIIKTDGTYIYKVASRFNNDTGYTDQILTITETDNGNLKALTSIDLSKEFNQEDVYANFHEFYLHNNYIIALYTLQDYRNENTETNIVIYDIKDKEHPRKVKTLTQSGWYESSRISDGFLYTISNFNDTNLATPTPYTNYIPCVNGKTIECSNIYYPQDVLMKTTYVITSVDLNKPNHFTDTAAIPTNGGQTYVSDTSIYIYTTIYDHITKTEITKIHYDKGILTPGESAIITGYFYDSFALSEYDGHLRMVATIPANNIALLRTTDIAVATNHSTIQEDVNVIYVLDHNMKLVGKLSGIAPGEQIYSARFMGSIAYFVTFKNVDPLFSVDLSDPTKPTILGQLKIPGFSNYLHIYENGLLLGLGEEIDANTSEFLGLKLSMFDVSDPTNVTEQDKYILEDSCYSEAQYNHKAIMIDPVKNIFGFTYWSTNDTTYDDFYYYVTYTYDEQKGFIETAKYPITDGSEYETDAVRGIYIGEYLYIATNKSLTSYQIGSTEPIAQIYFK